MTTDGPRFSRSPHLVDLVAEVERLAAAIGGAPAAARAELARVRADEAVLATLRLDGSRRTDVPAATVLHDALGTLTTPTGVARPGTWFDAMRTFDDPRDGADDDPVHALEFAGAAAALASDDLTGPLLRDPVPTLAELHVRTTRGLVAPERAGALRTVAQAVHDASVGRIVYFTTDPAGIAAELARLAGWLVSTGGREHALIASGVVHLELLRIHPYDAANGRLARAAARLLLRARGLDPDGLAVAEPALATDPGGYHDEVARTVRRRDHTIWLERWAEAVADGLRTSARRLGQLPATLPEPALALLEERLEETFTVTEQRAATGADPAQARAQLQALLDAGRIVRVPGSRGLRFRRQTG